MLANRAEALQGVTMKQDQTQEESSVNHFYYIGEHWKLMQAGRDKEIKIIIFNYTYILKQESSIIYSCLKEINMPR